MLVITSNLDFQWLVVSHCWLGASLNTGMCMNGLENFDMP